MYVAEKNTWLRYNQVSGGKYMSIIETGTLNELIIESHRIRRQLMCAHLDNVMR